MTEAQEANLTACNATSDRLLRLHGEMGSWREVGRALGVSGGMAYRVALQGYEPKDPEIRRILGFPVDPLVMGAPVFCAKCGRAFVGKWGSRRKFCPVCRPLTR